MAYIVGLIDAEERIELEARGWVVEDAANYNLIGDTDDYLLQCPSKKSIQAVVISVDEDLFKIMDDVLEV